MSENIRITLPGSRARRASETSSVPAARASASPASRSWRRLGLLAAAPACGLLLVGAPPAFAHDTLLSSSPESGETLQQSPDEITLEFSGSGLTTGETITNAIVLHDDEGESWEGETEVDGSTMSTDLPETLPNGEYEVTYRVVYSDGHDEEQSFSFDVEDPDAASPEPEDESASESAGPDATAESEDPGASPDSGSADSTADSDSASDTDDAANPVPAWALAGVAALIVAGGTALLVLRRRRK